MTDEPKEIPVEAASPKFGFFVYIVESPSAPDVYHGRSEGSLVAQTIRLDNIPCVVRTAINSEAFIAALKIGLPEAMTRIPNSVNIMAVN